MRGIRTFYFLLAILLLLAAGCRPQEKPTPTPVPTPIVPEKPTYVVQRGTVVKSIQFTGRIAPVEEEKLFFKTGGYIKNVFVKKGDAVQKGDLLAELEIGDLENQLAQAQLDLETARLQLTQAQQANEQDIARARAALETDQLQLAQARARLASVQADLTIAQAELEQLLAGADEQEVEIARLDLEQARNNLWSAQVHRDTLEKDDPARKQAEAAVANAEIAVRLAEIYYQEAQAGPGEEEIAVARARYEQARQTAVIQELEVRILEKNIALAQLNLQWLAEAPDPLLTKEVERAQLTVERLEKQLAEAQIFAPFDGQVMSVSAYAGRLAEAFKPLLIVADPTALEIRADLGSDQVQEMSVGQPATVVMMDYPDRELAGQVRKLPYLFGSGEALEEADRSTRISFDPEGLELEIGALARVTIELARKEDVLYLPPAAIRTFGGRKFVVVQDGEIQRRVDVKLGIEGEDRVEILEGLEEGQIVVGQ